MGNIKYKDSKMPRNLRNYEITSLKAIFEDCTGNMNCPYISIKFQKFKKFNCTVFIKITLHTTYKHILIA